jgi:hypothetical protein
MRGTEEAWAALRFLFIPALEVDEQWRARERRRLRTEEEDGAEGGRPKLGRISQRLGLTLMNSIENRVGLPIGFEPKWKNK